MRSTIMTLMLFSLLAGCIGCGNGANPTSLAKTYDTAPPAIPTGFQAASGPSVVKLSWLPNTADNDFLGYNIYRLVDGRSFLLNSQLLSDADFIDQKPWPTPVAYAVTATDIMGNESAYQTVVFVPEDEQPLRDIH